MPDLVQTQDVAPDAQLRRVLGPKDLTFLIVGSVIGSGIFLVPGGVLTETGGSIPLALSVWLVGGILTLLGALTYSEMTAMNPQAGGLYVFIRDGFGRLPAFLYGWALFAVIGSGGVSALAVAFSATLTQFIPLSLLQQKAVAVAMIAALVVVNVRGTRNSANLQNWTTALKAGVIILMSLVLLLVALGGSRSGVVAPQVPAISGSIASAFGVAMIGVLWAYDGWQQASFCAGETVQPHRTVPRSFITGTLLLVFIYMFANVGYLAALGPNGLAATQNAAASSLGSSVGGWAANLVAVVVLISMFSAANGGTLANPRVYYAMAADGLFFRKFTQVHPRTGTPVVAIIAGGAWSAFLAVNGKFSELLTTSIFAAWIFYGLGAAALFQYRRNMPEAERPFSVPGYPWTPLLFILAATALVGNTILSKPKEAAIGSGFVLLGLPAYAYWQATSRRCKTSTEESAATSL